MVNRSGKMQGVATADLEDDPYQRSKIQQQKKVEKKKSTSSSLEKVSSRNYLQHQKSKNNREKPAIPQNLITSLQQAHQRSISVQNIHTQVASGAQN